jgi:hypothetical protein
MMKKKKQIRDIPIEIRAEKALREAVANAIADHKRAGVPITIWCEGKAAQIPPEQIKIREEQAIYEILPKKVT